MYDGWNPWHGCTKISPGCAHCYVYRRDEAFGGTASKCRKTAAFDLPLRRGRSGGWKLPLGSWVYTCFTSDFLLADADDWRPDCWKMMRERSDCTFCFFTKRIERMGSCLPPDWGDGYDNVVVGCTVENQEMAERRLPVFAELPIKRRLIVAEPLLGPIDVSPWLGCVEEVCAGGESGKDARPCDFEWVLALRDACAERGVPFSFHQTGARFVRGGKLYKIPRRLQHVQAKKAGIDIPGPGERRKHPPEPTAEQLELPL